LLYGPSGTAVWTLDALRERARNSREGGREGCPRYKAKAKVRKIREIVECTVFECIEWKVSRCFGYLEAGSSTFSAGLPGSLRPRTARINVLRSPSYGTARCKLCLRHRVMTLLVC
jgi:hypothetical protein